MPPVCTVTRPSAVRTSKNPFPSRPAVTPMQACGPMHLNLPPANPGRRPLDARGNRLAAARSSSPRASRSSDFSRETSSAWRLMRRPTSRSSEVAGVDKSGAKSRWWTLMPTPTTANATKPSRAGFRVGLDQDAAGLARADQQIVGPAQIDASGRRRREWPRRRPARRPAATAAGARRECAGATARSRKAPRRRRSARRDRRGRGRPAAHRQSRPSRAARRLRAAASASVFVESVTARKMQLAGKDGVCERGFERGKIEHRASAVTPLQCAWRCRRPWPSESARPR